MAEETNVVETVVEETKETVTENEKPSYEELEAMLADKNKEYSKLKTSFDKASSDISALKKDLKSRKTEEETAAELRAENDRKLAIYEKMESLQKHYKAMDSETARKIAELEADGDFDAVHEVMNEYVEALVKQKSTDALLNRQRVNAGSGSIQITKEQFKGMSMEERSKLYNENKAEYERLKNLN